MHSKVQRRAHTQFNVGINLLSQNLTFFKLWVGVAWGCMGLFKLVWPHPHSQSGAFFFQKKFHSLSLRLGQEPWLGPLGTERCLGHPQVQRRAHIRFDAGITKLYDIFVFFKLVTLWCRWVSKGLARVASLSLTFLDLFFSNVSFIF
jgi:hypothetical protein